MRITKIMMTATTHLQMVRRFVGRATLGVIVLKEFNHHSSSALLKKMPPSLVLRWLRSLHGSEVHERVEHGGRSVNVVRIRGR